MYKMLADAKNVYRITMTRLVAIYVSVVQVDSNDTYMGTGAEIGAPRKGITQHLQCLDMG